MLNLLKALIIDKWKGKNLNSENAASESILHTALRSEGFAQHISCPLLL